MPVESSAKNAFSVDVEDYFHVSAFESVIDRAEWDSQESRVERNTDRLLELLAERGVKGTFFVLGWIAARHPTLVRRISEAGHEIGCHGQSHTKIYEQSPEKFREETLRAKAVLEETISAPVLGYRAASFSITAESLWALDALN